MTYRPSDETKERRARIRQARNNGRRAARNRAMKVLPEMTKTVIHRDCPGSYRVTRGRYEVEIVEQPEFAGPDKWIARALWDQYRYSDPVATYRRAKEIAFQMLDTAQDF